MLSLKVHLGDPDLKIKRATWNKQHHTAITRGGIDGYWAFETKPETEHVIRLGLFGIRAKTISPSAYALNFAYTIHPFYLIKGDKIED